MKKGFLIFIVICISVTVQAKWIGEGPQTKNQEYLAAINKHLNRNWLLLPSDIRSGLKCKLKIFQKPGGVINSVKIDGSCNADVETQKQLIRVAEMAGPLPYIGYEDVFTEEITVIFNYPNE